MFTISVEWIGDAAVVECDGKLVDSSDAFRLRDAVISKADAKIIILDLSEVYAVEGGGLGILVFLQRWTRDHDIRLALFNPSRSVRRRLELASAMSDFDIVALPELMALLGQPEHYYPVAA